MAPLDVCVISDQGQQTQLRKYPSGVLPLLAAEDDTAVKKKGDSEPASKIKPQC